MGRPRINAIAFGLFGIIGILSSCTSDTPKKHFALAERLWTAKNYEASVQEYDQVVRKDPQSSLGKQALFRAAITQSVFLNQQNAALEKLNLYLTKAESPETAWQARKEIGEILYERLRRYQQALDHYKTMVGLRPKDPEISEILFRIGKCNFFLWQFEEADAVFRDVQQRFPKTVWGERALYERGVVFFTQGEQRASERQGGGSEIYKHAIRAYEEFLSAYPKSKLAVEARFGIASCYEEMEQLELALQKFEDLEKTYPTPGVIRIKQIRIQERLAKRGGVKKP